MSEVDQTSGFTNTGNVIVTGKLLDCDEDFLYLSQDDKEICDAIRISDCARIMLETEEEEPIPNLREEQWN
jgi:hypothetical protein